MAKEKVCIDNYITRIGSSCRLSSLTNCLYNFGIDIDESIIFFLHDGFKISYELNEKANITSNETEAIQTFFKKNNIIENIVADNDINLLLKHLEGNIKKNLQLDVKNVEVSESTHHKKLIKKSKKFSLVLPYAHFLGGWLVVKIQMHRR